MHLAGLIPSLLLVWMQVSVLAAIGVALSTRFSLVVNLPAIILIYIAGNLTRFLYPLEATPGSPRASPRLSARSCRIWRCSTSGKKRSIRRSRSPTRSSRTSRRGAILDIWNLVGLAAIYAWRTRRSPLQRGCGRSGRENWVGRRDKPSLPLYSRGRGQGEGRRLEVRPLARKTHPRRGELPRPGFAVHPRQSKNPRRHSLPRRGCFWLVESNSTLRPSPCPLPRSTGERVQRAALFPLPALL